MSVRFEEHRKALVAGKHKSALLQAAWDSGDETDFEFSFLEICNANRLLERERYFIARLCPAFNCQENPGKRPRKKMSDQGRANISAGLMGNQNLLGHRHSEATRRKISLSQKNRLAKKVDK